jgi:hypothetical protein
MRHRPEYGQRIADFVAERGERLWIADSGAVHVRLEDRQVTISVAPDEATARELAEAAITRDEAD